MSNITTHRARDGHYMNPVTIGERFPTLAQTAAHDSRSDRYQQVSSVNAINVLADSGFMPVEVQLKKPRNTDKVGFEKHVVRFQPTLKSLREIGDSRPEIVLINSHDGSTSFQLFAGLFRLVCANGMVVKNADFGGINVRHVGDSVLDEISFGAEKIIGDFPKLVENHNRLNALTWSPNTQRAFANEAVQLRWDDQAPIQGEQLLRAKRYEDIAGSRFDLGDRSAWKTLNVVQENLIRGGNRGRNRNGGRMTTRAVTGIDMVQNINTGVWQLAEQFAEAA